MIGFALCHGWAFDQKAMQAFVHSLRAHFPHAEFVSYDLGFTGRPHAPSPDDMAKAGVHWIAVGHSYGFAYLLQQAVPWRAAISVNGFTRFCRQPGKPEGMPVRLLDAMLARLQTEPQATVTEFQERCGSAQPVPQGLDVPLLGQHLQKLRDLDLTLPDTPILSLSARDDLIVPPSLTRACFASKPCKMHEYEGSHLRLLQEPQACIDTIAAYVETHCGN